MNKNWIERKERTYLKNVLPLQYPFSMQAEVTRYCNFKCIYCVHSSEKLKYKPIMSIDLFNKFLEGFDKTMRLKTFTFSGIGEPLLNKNIFQMIKNVKNYSDKVILISNGALLIPEVTDKLISSGLDEIRISLQGLNSDEYKKTCGYNIDFQEFLHNLDYLYKNKKQCEVIFKIADIVINTEKKKKTLYQIFSNKCDFITIQSICPLHNEIDYTKIKDNYSETIYQDNKLREVKVCPQPFYSMQLMADGKIRPCCMLEPECFEIGDINENTIIEIWNGDKLNYLRKLHLLGESKKINSCENCNYPTYLDNIYDNIDDYANEIFKKMSSREW